MPKSSIWYHWPLAILALVWTLIASADYVLTKLQAGFYVSMVTPDQLAYFLSLPLWISMAWAIGVWAGLAGAILLLRRSRAAATMFALSFVGLMVMTAGLEFLADPPLSQVAGSWGIPVQLVAIGLSFLFFVCARGMNVRAHHV